MLRSSQFAHLRQTSGKKLQQNCNKPYSHVHMCVEHTTPFYPMEIDSFQRTGIFQTQINVLRKSTQLIAHC